MFVCVFVCVCMIIKIIIYLSKGRLFKYKHTYNYYTLYNVLTLTFIHLLNQMVIEECQPSLLFPSEIESTIALLDATSSECQHILIENGEFSRFSC